MTRRSHAKPAPPEASFAAAEPRGYLYESRRPLNSLLFILVPLTVYQVFALMYGTRLLAPRDMARFLKYFGATATLLPAALIVVVLLVQHFFHRRRWSLDPPVLLGMLAESVVWMLPLLAMNSFTRVPMSAQTAPAAPPGPGPFVREVLQGLGAGIYEEFIFRLVLAGLILFVLADLLEFRREVSAVVAIFVQAALFSLYHLTHAELTGQTPFPWGPFSFRMFAGAYLGGLYVLRGYGITVGAHAAWNVYVAWVST